MLVRLAKSKDGKSGHFHFAYIGQDQNGISSVDNKHSHQIIFNQPVEPAIDELSGFTIDNGSPGGLQVIDVNGHTHEIVGPIESINKDLFKTPKTDDDTKGKSVQRVKALYKEGKSIELDSYEDGEQAEKMYEGDQWDIGIKTGLLAEARAAMTVNEIEGKIDLLSGVQRQNRFDITAFPNEEGDATVADILTICIKNAHSNTNFEEHETEVFPDQAIVGRGLYNVDTDFDKDIRGKFVVEKFNWRDAIFGPHEKLDASDADYMVKHKWLSFSKIKQMFPELSDQITIDTEALLDKEKDTTGASDIEPVKSQAYDEAFGKTNSADEDTVFVNISKKQYRLMECWQKKFAQVFIIVNAIDGFFESLHGWNKEDINKIKTIQGVNVIPRVIYQFRVTKVAGNTLLEDEFPDLPVIAGEQFYPIVPVYAKKRRNRFWGKVKPVIDLQKENNKRHSQLMDILARVLPYGWFYDEDTFANAADEANWKKEANKPGFTAKVQRMDNKPELQQGVKYPAELTVSISNASQQMKETMNINSELLGQTGSRQSGVAIRENKRQGLLGNDFLFDNLAFAHRRIGLMTIAHIQKYWGTDRIMKVLGFEQGNNSDLSLGGIQASNMQPQDYEAIAKIIEDTDLTTYDISVAESPHTPTARLAQFIQIQELAKQGVPIAPATLIRMSDMSDKDLAMKELAEYAQQIAQQENIKYKTEIEKTAMNNKNQQGGVR